MLRDYYLPNITQPEQKGSDLNSGFLIPYTWLVLLFEVPV